ncbi:MAG TPA: glutathione S-transferase, partial [Gammaproteobacteria bacterium]|nr:glutathione S-transferase [Gammaproteobacteria bacterium]
EATVPVLLLPDGDVFDESWEIVKWALSQNDPDNWTGDNDEYLLEADILIETNDFSFKVDLDHYKYADRYPEHTPEHYRIACERFIEELEDLLANNDYLLTDRPTLADIGVFPFVRQFSLVDKVGFERSPYPEVRNWLTGLLESELFRQTFQKHKTWEPGDEPVYLRCRSD